MSSQTPTPEYPRRQRLFRRAIFVLGALQVGYLVAYFAGVLSLWASAVGIVGLIVGGLLVFTAGVRRGPAPPPRGGGAPLQGEAVGPRPPRVWRGGRVRGVRVRWWT